MMVSRSREADARDSQLQRCLLLFYALLTTCERGDPSIRQRHHFKLAELRFSRYPSTERPSGLVDNAE